MSSNAGSNNSTADKTMSAIPIQVGGNADSAPSPSVALMARAGASFTAARAGMAAPATPAAIPRLVKKASIGQVHCATGAAPAKNPLPRSPPNLASANVASHNPSAVPTTPPMQPNTAPSAIKARSSSLRVTPRVRYSANCARRRNTDRLCVENTRNPPVNSATSDNTVRLMR